MSSALNNTKAFLLLFARFVVEIWRKFVRDLSFRVGNTTSLCSAYSNGNIWTIGFLRKRNDLVGFYQRFHRRSTELSFFFLLFLLFFHFSIICCRSEQLTPWCGNTYLCCANSLISSDSRDRLCAQRVGVLNLIFGYLGVLVCSCKNTHRKIIVQNTTKTATQ